MEGALARRMMLGEPGFRALNYLVLSLSARFRPPGRLILTPLWSVVGSISPSRRSIEFGTRP